MGSVPNHPLWKWLIPQTIKRYFNDRNPKDEKDATKITGPIALDNVVQRNPEITRTCVLLKPDVTGPAYVGFPFSLSLSLSLSSLHSL